MRFKWWLFITAGVFIIGFVVGLVLSLTMPGAVANLLSEELAALQRLGAMLRPFHLATAAFILLKNASTLLLSFLLSPLLCLFPIAALMFNGVILASVAVLAARQASVSVVLFGLLPHGIFEIPALVIGEAAAVSFGVMALTALVSAEKRKLLIPNLKQNLRYLALAGALLVPAAVIETFITPLFLT